MSAVVEQLPTGFRYRVTQGASLVASSPIFTGLDTCLYALQKRFPGMQVDRICVL
jgi:hypothetical protein